MDIIVILIIGLVIGVSAFRALHSESAALEAKCQSWCRSRGLEFVSYEIYSRPHRNGRYGPVLPGTVTVKFRRSSGESVEEAVGKWQPGTLQNVILDIEAPRQSSQLPDDIGGANAEELTEEEQIMLEVSRRLDQITSEAGWAREHDKDGSGHVDSQEWDELRRKIEAEVRASFKPSAVRETPKESPVLKQPADVEIQTEDEDESIW